MHSGADSGAGPGLVEALVARVDDIDAQLRATSAAVDEKSLKEFRRTVEALSKRDPKFEDRVTNRVDVLADRLETLARTVKTTSAALAAKDGEIAQLRRDLDAGSARFQTAVADARRGHDPAALAEIKRTLAELSKQKLPRGLEGRIDELGAKVTMLAQRIDTVSTTVSTTAAGLAGRDGDVIALRRAYEAESDRIGAELAELRRTIDPTPVAELRQSVAELRERTADQRRAIQVLLDDANAKTDTLGTRIDALAASVTSATARISGNEEQLAALRGHVEEGGVHLNTLAAAVASASEHLGERDVELEALEQRFRTASTRVDGLVAELTRALAEFPDPQAVDQLLESRLRELDDVRVHDRVRIEEVADRLEALITSLGGRTPELEALEQRIDDLLVKLEAVDDRAGDSGEVARLAAIIEVERGSVRARLDSLAASVERSSGTLAADALDRRVATLGGRFDALEREREAQAAEIGRLASTFDTERASFQTQLEALAAALSWTSRKSPVDDRLDEFDERMGGLERQGAAVASKVSQATTLLPAALRSLESRLDEIAPRPPGTTVSEHLPPVQPAPEHPEPIVEGAEHDPGEDEANYPMPTGVGPIRGTDT